MTSFQRVCWFLCGVGFARSWLILWAVFIECFSGAQGLPSDLFDCYFGAPLPLSTTNFLEGWKGLRQAFHIFLQQVQFVATTSPLTPADDHHPIM